MDVFVYGTLTDPDQVAEVVDDFEFRGDAVLIGLHRVECEYPTLAPGGEVECEYPTLAPGGEVEGRILATDAIAGLDEYEGVDRGLYVRVPVPRGRPWEWAGTANTVETYVGAPTALGVEEPVEWSGEGPFEERVRATIAGCEVRRRQ